MSIILNQELALIAYIIGLGQYCIDNHAARFEQVTIRPSAIIEYANGFKFANCGPIVKMFSEKSLANLMSQYEFFVQTEKDGEYKIKQEHRIFKKFVAHPDECNLDFINRALIRALVPYLNYPSRFLEYIGIMRW